MDVRKSRRLPSAATVPGVKYRLLLRVYAAENLRKVSSHGTYCKVYVGNVDMAASRKGRQSFKKFLMSSSLSASSSGSSASTTPSSSYSSSTSSAGSPNDGASPQENLSRSQHNVQNSNNGGINTAGTRVREFKTQVQKYSRASPVWNEKFEIPSVDPMGDLVSIRVKSARLMSSPAVGACCVPLGDVPEDETVDRWVSLQDGKKDAGRIRIQMRLVRADTPPAVKKESSAGRSRSQASDPVVDDQVRASARRISSKRSSNSSSLSRTRLSGSISPVAKQALQSATTDTYPAIQEAQPLRKLSNSSNHSSSSSTIGKNHNHSSRSESRASSRTQSEREASMIAARYATPAQSQPHRPQSPVNDTSNPRKISATTATTTDLLLVDLEHASETSSSSSSSSFVSAGGGIKSDKTATATHSTKKTIATSSSSRHRQKHNDVDNDEEDANSGDVVEASSLYSSMQHIRDRGTMLSEIGASSSLLSSSRSNGSFVGSLHLYNRNSIATSTPSRTTMVMSEAEIAALHSEYSTSGANGSAQSNGGRRRSPNGGADDRNSGQTEDTDSEEEDDDPETEGPRIPWNSTITRLLARKSTNILIDEDEEDDSDDDDTHHQRHGGGLNIDILHDRLGHRHEEVPLLDFPEPYDIDEIDCA